MRGNFLEEEGCAAPFAGRKTAFPMAPSPGFGFASAGLSTAGGEASGSIWLTCYKPGSLRLYHLRKSLGGRTDEH